MKKLSQLFAAGGLFVILFGALHANPPVKMFPEGTFKAGHLASIERLQKGDQYAVICTVCRTMVIKTVGAAKETAALCHEGGTIHCDVCEADRLIKRITSHGRKYPAIVDEHGKECMMIVPLKND